MSDLITQPVRADGRVRHMRLASAVAEFGMLLRAGDRNAARWDALSSRVHQLEVPPGLRSDMDSFKELVAIAQGLSRLR